MHEMIGRGPGISMTAYRGSFAQLTMQDVTALRKPHFLITHNKYTSKQRPNLTPYDRTKGAKYAQGILSISKGRENGENHSALYETRRVTHHGATQSCFTYRGILTCHPHQERRPVHGKRRPSFPSDESDQRWLADVLPRDGCRRRR